MLKRILPKEDKYFDRFDQMSDLLAQASAIMMTAIDHSAEASSKAMILSEYEVQADQITHTMLEYLHRTFITPFDRNDIHDLIFKMQKVVDFLSGTVCHLVDTRVIDISPDIKSLAKLADEQVMLVASAVPGLRNLQSPEHLVELCGKIHQTKYRSKALSRKISADLLEISDVRFMLKLRDLVNNLNLSISCCVEIAHRLEAIVLEYA